MKINDENRSKMIEDYVGNIVDSMDTKTLCQLAYDFLVQDKSSYTNEQLETEILDYYPELLEEDV